MRSRYSMDHLTQQLGLRLRRLRQQRNWSLDRLATASGVSKAMLGQIERGESSPTVVTLWRIAGGLGVAFSDLMASPAADWQPFWLQHETLPPQVFGDGIQVTPLLPFEPRLGYELLKVELPVGCVYQSVAHEPGAVEQVLPVSGLLSIYVDGIWHPLGGGSVLRFAADAVHGYRNDGDVVACFHNLIAYPAGRHGLDDQETGA